MCKFEDLRILNIYFSGFKDTLNFEFRIFLNFYEVDLDSKLCSYILFEKLLHILCMKIDVCDPLKIWRHATEQKMWVF